MIRRLLALAMTLFTPAVAHACPVCFDPNEENRWAFIFTTVLLSTLPLLMVGGVVLWIRDTVRASGGEARRGSMSSSGAAPATDP